MNNLTSKLKGNKVFNLKEKLDNECLCHEYKTFQYGGDMSKDQFGKNRKHNLSVYFDKGSNNFWMQKEKNQPDESIVGMQLDEFETYIKKIMDTRYYVRANSLYELFSETNLTYGPVKNLSFLDNFYMYLFKGTVIKKIFPNDERGNPTVNDDDRKRYNIFYEYIEEEDKLPKKRYYTFVDTPNPCHLIKIMKDEYGREEKKDIAPIKYAFTNIKELGRGKAGVASLFAYYNEISPNLQIAAKLMSSNEFDLTNDGKYLPLQIVYFDESVDSPSLSLLDNNMRFIYPKSTLDELKMYHRDFVKYNVFETTHLKYKNVMLSVASDNFSNQTLIHMILDLILKPLDINGYITQYDAMLCMNSESNFENEEATRFYEYIKSGTLSILNYVKETFNKKITVDGLNFMEIADAGDLYGHLFDVQKRYFSTVRTIKDLDVKFDKLLIGQFTDEFKISIEGEHTYYGIIRAFLDKMISQILQVLSILKNSKYEFIHGDLKTKNIFVKSDSENGYIYKVADYDKSSINYNGIRFYNKGNNFVKLYLGMMGPSEFSKSKTKLEKIDSKNTSWMSYITKNILKYKEGEIREYDLDKSTHIDKLFENDELDKTNIIFDMLLRFYEKHTKGKDENINQNLFDKLMMVKTKGLELADLINLFRNKLKVILETNNKKYGSLETPVDIRALHSEKVTDEIMVNVIIEYLNIFLRLKNDNCKIDIFYTLNSFIARLSAMFTNLEDIEMEQMHVRYLPIPFYTTIDLYTLFLSLLQSPMVLTYLKYCHDSVIKGNKLDSEHGLFWNSFRRLWISDDDIYTLFNYYDYLYLNPTLDDEATISYILDPIKKNPISLLKEIPNEYWKQSWLEIGDRIFEDKLEKDRENDKDIPKLDLSAGNISLMPQIQLSECGDFDMKVHKNGQVFYMNKDLIVYNKASIGEMTSALKDRTASLNKETSDNYKNMLKESVIQFASSYENNKLQFAKHFLLGKSEKPEEPEKILREQLEKLDREINELQHDEKNFELLITKNNEDIKSIINSHLYIYGLFKNTRLSAISINIVNKINFGLLDERIRKIISHMILEMALKDVSDVEKELDEEKMEAPRSNKMKRLISIFDKERHSSDGSKERHSSDGSKEMEDVGEFKEMEVEDPTITELNKGISMLNKTLIEIEIPKYQQEYNNKIKINLIEIEHLKEINKEIPLELVEKAKDILNKIFEMEPTVDMTVDAYAESKLKTRKSGNDLIKICRTNTYKDLFGNDVNWDFCPYGRDEIMEIFKEIIDVILSESPSSKS
jgi:hypothetical protein